MSAYHSTKLMREKCQRALATAEAAQAHAVKNLSPRAKALSRVVSRLQVILAQEVEVTYGKAQAAPEARELTVEEATLLLAQANARAAAAREAQAAADIAAQAAALAAEVDARLAEEDAASQSEEIQSAR